MCSRRAAISSDRARNVLADDLGKRVVFRELGQQPALAATQELVDLGLVDPVVLLVVEDGYKDIEVAEEIAPPDGRGEANRVRRVA